MTRRTDIFLLMLLVGACVRDPESTDVAPAAQPRFVDVTTTCGVDFVHDPAVGDHRLHIPEIMSGGGAVLDIDGDGDLDLYLVQAGPVESPGGDASRNRLYRNDGDGTFTDITRGSGADDAGCGFGAATGDYDGDGDLDLYVTNVGPDVLLRCEGDGTFTNVTAEAGLDCPGFSSSAAFLDGDGDGDLDLFTCVYIEYDPVREPACRRTSFAVDGLRVSGGNPGRAMEYCDPEVYAPVSDRFFRNEGDGTFTDVTVASGIGAHPSKGLGVVALDVDEDGDLDLFVASDGMRDHLWINDGHGHFTERGLATGCALDLSGTAKAGMGVTVGDLDDDGHQDLLVGNIESQTDSVFRGDGSGTFEDMTRGSGLMLEPSQYTRFGLAFVDLDNDGDLDLYQANGRVYRYAPRHADDPYAEPNLLWELRDGRFHEVLPRGGTAQMLIASSRGAIFADLDDDGGMDVVVVNRDAPPHVLMNRGPRGHWVRLAILDGGGPVLNAQVRGTVNGRRITRGARTAYSYASANDPRVHVGLGTGTVLEDVVVRWPDGTVEAFGDLDGDREHRLARGAGDAASWR